MGDIDFQKQYLPGYTGHVPKKNEIYGCTSGDINRIITGQGYKPSNYDVDITKNVSDELFGSRTFYSKPPLKDGQTHSLQYGNVSKHGNNWIGGPSNNVRAQHIPGYKGYVPNIKAENIYGKSFAQSTSQAINREFTQGIELPAQERFLTTTNSQFNKTNFRRIKDQLEPADVKDHIQAANFRDAEQVLQITKLFYRFQGLEVQKRNIYLDMPTVGYQGFKSVYRPQTVSIAHRKDPFFNINPLRARIRETNLEEDRNFQGMSEGFQRAATANIAKRGTSTTTNGFRQTTYNNPNTQSQPDLIKIPIAGYTGHRAGYKAQNFYGKNFRDCAIQSKFVQKLTQ